MQSNALVYILALFLFSTPVWSQNPKEVRKSLTSELEHNIYIGFGFSQQSISMASVSFPFSQPQDWVSDVQPRQMPQLEVTFSKWFEKRHYLGATFRTGKIGYDITLADNPEYRFHNPEVPQQPVISFESWHSNYLGVFWQLEITPEIYLTKNQKHNWIYQLSSFTELGFNFMSAGWDRQENLEIPNSNGANSFIDWRVEYVRTTQIRGGFRLRNALIKAQYSLAFDMGWNGGYRDFHFLDDLDTSESSPVNLVEIRNSNHYFFANLCLGYWF